MDAALAAYSAAGGEVGPADLTAFTGVLAARLSFAAYLLWISCGHRGSAPDHQVQASLALQEALMTLPNLRNGIERWAGWLG